MSHPFSKPKFLSLTPLQKHKHAATVLKTGYLTGNFDLYRDLENWLELSPLSLTAEEISDRYHLHLHNGDNSLQENHFLPRMSQGDSPSDEPYLPLHIYLDSLRSAHNVGSIIRTVEAFRLGTLHFNSKTPPPTHKKVQDTSMGSWDKIPYQIATPLEALPKPLIALETVETATSLFDFNFPTTFTLLVGNEEFGLSQKSLELADSYVQIPLVGFKNSLNVANAFAIAAAFIRNRKSP